MSSENSGKENSLDTEYGKIKGCYDKPHKHDSRPFEITC